MTPENSTLAQRLGVTVHVSPLRIRLADLMREFPSSGAQCLEDWLLDVANARGARFVTRWPPASPNFTPPIPATLSNEELVVAICQPHNLDRPQMLRAAAQLVSMQAVNAEILLATARRERAELVLAELARQAVHVVPEHPIWSVVLRTFHGNKHLNVPVKLTFGHMTTKGRNIGCYSYAQTWFELSHDYRTGLVAHL